MTSQQKENFQEFLGIVRSETLVNACDEVHKEQNDIAEVGVEEVNDAPNTIGVDSVIGGRETDVDDSYKMSVNSFDLNFSGKFNRNALFNTLIYMIPEEANVRININCEILD